MTVDTPAKTLLVVSALAIAVPAAFFFWKTPDAELSSSEIEVMNFSGSPSMNIGPRSREAFSGLNWPVRASLKKPASADGAGTEIRPAGRNYSSITALMGRKPRRRYNNDSPPQISMIYYDNNMKYAIIDGQVLREGSTFGNSLVVKIEKRRVLMRNAGKDLWLSFD
jgi:hypothetical protein